MHRPGGLDGTEGAVEVALGTCIAKAGVSQEAGFQKVSLCGFKLEPASASCGLDVGLPPELLWQLCTLQHPRLREIRSGSGSRIRFTQGAASGPPAFFFPQM